jgi:hypothetical protein
LAEKKPKSKSSALAQLTPNAFIVPINGTDVTVAANKEENTILNMLLASRMRAVIQKTMEDYKDDEVKFTPKELRDLAAAARDVAAFSAEVYASAEPLGKTEKPAEQENDLSFEVLTKPVEEEKPNE